MSETFVLKSAFTLLKMSKKMIWKKFQRNIHFYRIFSSHKKSQSAEKRVVRSPFGAKLAILRVGNFLFQQARTKTVQEGTYGVKLPFNPDVSECFFCFHFLNLLPQSLSSPENCTVKRKYTENVMS